jgi:hypothetical protein
MATMVVCHKGKGRFNVDASYFPSDANPERFDNMSDAVRAMSNHLDHTDHAHSFTNNGHSRIAPAEKRRRQLLQLQDLRQ